MSIFYSLQKDLEIRYYAMMSRFAQFTRRRVVIKNLEVLIPAKYNSETTNTKLVKISIEKKLVREAVTA
jgi:hypothetical protein